LEVRVDYSFDKEKVSEVTAQFKTTLEYALIALAM
jgi:hypothetical protein